MYRIAWRSKITGLGGHGEYILSFRDGTDIIKELNAELCNIEHWLEPMKVNLNGQTCSYGDETFTN